MRTKKTVENKYVMPAYLEATVNANITPAKKVYKKLFFVRE
jgi:hypothetical protein